jgi:uncharacterized protein (TIGR00297 family)
MKTFLTLDAKATLVALAMGIVMLLLAWPAYGLFFFLVMLWFLAISALVTFAGTAYKKKKGLYEKRRGVKNVIANGLLPLIIVIMFAIFRAYHFEILELFAVAGFVSAVSAVSADKFSSELGVLDGEPRMIFNFKRVKKGTSGGVTLFGLLMGFIGSLLASITVLAAPHIALLHMPLLIIFVLALIAGFLGTVFDSMLGYFEEKGMGNKFTSNFFAAVGASVVCVVLLALFI